ncbi:MAG: hypothetical protein ABL940_06050 [Bacteroidia bacterium]
MDFYLNSQNSFNRLVDEYKQHNSLVVAFDFDDTVYDFHKKGRLYTDVITLLQKLKAINCYLICWTGQQDEAFVAQYLTQQNIPFDAINKNPQFHKSTSPKIYANVYLDDRAGLQQVYNELNNLVLTINGEKLKDKVEELSAEIHNQWTAWAKELIASEPTISQERQARWRTECFKNYDELSEDMKQLDRNFAMKILNLL